MSPILSVPKSIVVSILKGFGRGCMPSPATWDAAMFRGRYIVSSTVKDASGLSKGDSVQMRGVGIGRVQKFVISSNGVKVTSREEIARATKRLDTLSASAERTSATVESSAKALDAVLGRIQRGEGTLGKLSTDDAANPKKYLKVSVF